VRSKIWSEIHHRTRTVTSKGFAGPLSSFKNPEVKMGIFFGLLTYGSMRSVGMKKSEMRSSLTTLQLPGVPAIEFM
jgi:hypothetical protein